MYGLWDLSWQASSLGLESWCATTFGEPVAKSDCVWTEKQLERVKMTKVYLREGESPEHLLKRFRKKVTRDRILSDIKKKRFFVSNSEKRRLAMRKARRRERRRKWRMDRRRRN